MAGMVKYLVAIRRFKLNFKLVIVCLCFVAFVEWRLMQRASWTADFLIETDPDLKLSSPAVTKERLDRLLRVLASKEKDYEPVLNRLDVLSFRRLSQPNQKGELPISEPNSGLYGEEARLYLQVVDGELQATDRFLRDLRAVSHNYSFQSYGEGQRSRVETKGLNQPEVIMLTADKKYFQPLTEVIRNIQEHFQPEVRIIIYDLGLTHRMRTLVIDMCRRSCELRLFDKDGEYSKYSPHVLNLNTYSFKPLIIQEVLKNYNTVIYVDTSIRFQNTSLVSYWLERTEQIAFLSRFIDTRLACYTDPRTFEWFGAAERHEYSHMKSLEANFFVFRRSLVLAIMMKAWVQCALDARCIAPDGAHIYGSSRNWGLLGPDCSACGCHRFDQSAMAFISSHFYEHPMGSGHLPPFALDNHLRHEAPEHGSVFQVRRRSVLAYIGDQVANLFSF